MNMVVLINGNCMKYQGNIMREGDFFRRRGIMGRACLVNLGSLHVDISQQQELIHNDTAKEDSYDHDRHLGHPKMAVQT